MSAPVVDLGHVRLRGRAAAYVDIAAVNRQAAAEHRLLARALTQPEPIVNLHSQLARQYEQLAETYDRASVELEQWVDADGDVPGQDDRDFYDEDADVFPNCTGCSSVSFGSGGEFDRCPDHARSRS